LEVNVEIIRLPVGQRASSETDCIRIQETPNSQFELEGSVLLNCGDGEEAESVSLIGSDPYETLEDAEAAGLAWAGEHCVEVIYVSRSDGAKPLADLP
jgi:hypothetical protein